MPEYRDIILGFSYEKMVLLNYILIFRTCEQAVVKK